MTIEETIKVLRSLYNVQRLDTLTQEEMTAVNVAIQNLENEQKLKEVIKNIKADINESITIAKNVNADTMYQIGLIAAQTIIDKYTEEKE